MDGQILEVYNVTDGIQTGPLHLDEQDKADLELLFELGVNVSPGTEQEVTFRVRYVA